MRGGADRGGHRDSGRFAVAAGAQATARCVPRPSRSMRELGPTTSSAKPLLTVAQGTGVSGYRTSSCACTSLGVIGAAEPMRISRLAVRAQPCRRRRSSRTRPVHLGKALRLGRARTLDPCEILGVR